MDGETRARGRGAGRTAGRDAAVMNHACAGAVKRPGLYSPIPCSKPAKVEEDGKWWCKSHASSEVRKRRAAADERDEQQRVAEREERERWQAVQRRAVLCVATCAGVPDKYLLPGFLAKLLEAADAAGFTVAIVRETAP